MEVTMATPRKTPATKTNFQKTRYEPLAACGSLDTPYKIRALMRRVITHQFKGELSSSAQSAINGSATIALKTLEMGEIEERISVLESKLKKAIKGGKKHKKKKKSNTIQPAGVPD